MTTETGHTKYVWRRDTEAEPSRWVWWVIGGIVALCGFGAFAAYMAEDTGQISTFVALGAIGSVLFWFIPHVFTWGRRRNPDIVMDGREMVWSKKRVSIDQVDRWSVQITTSTMYNGTVRSSMTIGTVRFHLFDGESETFTFPHLTEIERAELIVALEPILPGRRID